MESRDIEISKQIGQILYDAAPNGAQKIFMNAELAATGDVCKFEYDFLRPDGSKDWFLPEDGMVDQKLRELLVQHREFFVSQNQPPWKVFQFMVDVQNGKFSLELSYD